MPDDHEQIVVRRRKLAALRAQGATAYPNDFRPDQSAAEVQARFGGLDDVALADAPGVRVAGRVVAVRDFGKAGFLKIQEGGQHLQVYARRDALGEEGFATYRGLDVGDIVGVVGRPFRTRTRELTVAADELRLLVKALRPLPEKWHGLQDVEARSRQRYVDLIANPETRRTFETRTAIIRFLRDFLAGRGFLEVETPVMQPIYGGGSARPFVTHHNTLDLELYLRISPELYLKRLVVGGLERVFEISRNFRNEGIDSTHFPEFTILEFYQAYATYTDLMDLTEEMLVGLARDVGGTLQYRWRDMDIDLTPPWPRRSMVELVAEQAGESPDRLLEPAVIAAVAERSGGVERPGMSPGELLGLCFERLVEPGLIQPSFVTQFPVETSPLARRNDRDPRFVDRFELFIGRTEFANAFSELNDPEDQRARFEAQRAARAAGDEEAQMMDEDYVQALEYGLPPTAGEGIGLDRVVMLLTGATAIRDVLLFPSLRREGRS
jgi:lysyl-tRNA synthetase, class II